MSRTVQAVLWDVGGVFLPSPFSHIRAFGAEIGMDGDELLELVFGPYHEDTDHPWHRLERGELSFADTNEGLISQAAARGVDVDPMAVLMQMGSGEGARMARPDVVALAQRIRADGLRTAIITNNIAEFREGWKSLFDIDSMVELVIDSSEVGLRKPDPAIFLLALEQPRRHRPRAGRLPGRRPRQRRRRPRHRHPSHPRRGRLRPRHGRAGGPPRPLSVSRVDRERTRT